MEPQPRLVSPASRLPSGANARRLTPHCSPLRNGKHAPWNTPLTFSSATRITHDFVWSPTKHWPANGPNFPPVVSHTGSLAEFPMRPYGNQTAGGVTGGRPEGAIAA